MLGSITPLGERSRGRRWGITVTAFGLAATAAGGAAGTLLGAVGGAGRRDGARGRRGAGGGRMRLEAHGIAVDLPSGWDGRIWRRPGGGPVVHAANVALPASDGDFATTATGSLPADGVVVVLVEY